MSEKSGAVVNPSEASISDNSLEPQAVQTSKRRMMVGAVASAFVALLGPRPKPAEAQLLPTTPPDSIAPQPGVKPESPKSDSGPGKAPGNDAGMGSRESYPQEEKERDLKTSIQRKARVAKNFLLTPPGQTPPDITVEYVKDNSVRQTTIIASEVSVLSKDPKKQTTQTPKISIKISPKDATPDSQITLEACEKLAEIMNKVGRSKNLTDNFSLAFKKFTRIYPTLSANDGLDENKTLKLSQIAHYFDFSEYTDGIARDNPFSNKELLSVTFLKKAMSIWMCESEQLSQKLKEAPAFEGAEMSNVFLFTLKLMGDHISNTPEALKSLGIKKSTMENIVAMSGNEDFKQYFTSKGLL